MSLSADDHADPCTPPDPAGDRPPMSDAELADRLNRTLMKIRELGTLADQMTGLAHRVHLAQIRGQEDEFYDATEQLLILSEQLNEKYTELMVIRVPGNSAQLWAQIASRARRQVMST